MGNRAQIIGIGFVAGLSIGIVVGAVTDNMGLWIGIGTAIGLGCVDISSEPYESTDEVQESQETR